MADEEVVVKEGEVKVEPKSEVEVKSEVKSEPEAKKSVIGDVKDGEKKTIEGEEKSLADKTPAVFDPKALKLPDGYTVDDKLINEVRAAVPDLDNEKAQKLIDIHVGALKAAREAPIDFWNKQQVEWVKEMAANKDFGSGNPDAPLKPEVAARIAKVLDTFGSPAVREVFDATGAGNNPAIAAFMDKISKVLVEGGHVGGDPATKAQDPTKAFGFNYELGGVPKT